MQWSSLLSVTRNYLVLAAHQSKLKKKKKVLPQKENVLMKRLQDELL